MLQLIKYRFHVIKKILPYAKGIKKFFIFNLLVSVLLIATEFLIPLLYKVFIEETIILGRIETLFGIILGYLGLHLFTIAIQYVKNYNTNRIRNHVTFLLKYKIWNGLFKVNFPEYEHLNIGDIKMQLEDDTTAISNFSGSYTIDYFIHFSTTVISVCVLFVMEWRLALFSVICIPLTIAIDYVLSKREMLLNSEQRENDQEMNTWLYNSLHSWKEIKALNLENRQKVVFTDYIKRYAVYYAKWVNFWVFRTLIIPKIRNDFFMQFGLYFLGGLLVMKGELGIGNLLVFVTYFQMLTGGVLNISSIDADLQGKKPYIERLFSALDREYSKDGEEQIDKIDSIRLTDIHYHYPDSAEILRGVDLIIRAGERVAITGKSGCGKTTLLKIIVGMLQPVKGTVTYSGKDIKKLKLSSLYKKIGFIMQDNCLFDMTIKENILLGNKNVSERELVEACKKACIYDFIMSLPDGFDTIIGEGGGKLSGGQRQRIILARTFLRDVDVFIFDEATSALDQYSEKLINDAIANVGEDKIVIIVAHRDSSIQLCDRVVQLG